MLTRGESCPGLPQLVRRRPRNPEESLLFQVVAGELETFLAAQQDNERQVPGLHREGVSIVSRLRRARPGLPPDRVQHLQAGPRRGVLLLSAVGNYQQLQLSE